MTWFQDAEGNTSFTRVMGAVIILWSLLVLTVHTITAGKLPTLPEASTFVTLIGGALAGKVAQKPFEKKEKAHGLDIHSSARGSQASTDPDSAGRVLGQGPGGKKRSRGTK